VIGLTRRNFLDQTNTTITTKGTSSLKVAGQTTTSKIKKLNSASVLFFFTSWFLFSLKCIHLI